MTPVFAHGRLRLYLLKLLDEGPRHGYDVIRELEDRFLGLYSPSAGTVYPRLAQLAAEGLVRCEVTDGRKLYGLTEAGRAEVAARRGDLVDVEREIAESVRTLAGEVRSEVHASVRDLQAELRAAAKDVRRRQRHATRRHGRDRAAAGAGLQSQDEVADLAAIDAVIDSFRADLRAAVRSRALRGNDVAELRAALARALDDVLGRI